MKNTYTIVAKCLMVAGVGLMVVSAYFGWRDWQESRPQPDAYVIDDADRMLLDAVGGTKQELSFTIRNVSDRTIKIVGVESSCGDKNCCLRGRLDDHIKIPPGGSHALPFEVSIGQPGEFSHRVQVFIDDGKWLRMPTVGVRGRASAPPASPQPSAAKP